MEAVRGLCQEFCIKQGLNNIQMLDPNISTKGHRADAIWTSDLVLPSDFAIELIANSIKKIEQVAVGCTKSCAQSSCFVIECSSIGRCSHICHMEGRRVAYHAVCRQLASSHPY